LVVVVAVITQRLQLHLEVLVEVVMVIHREDLVLVLPELLVKEMLVAMDKTLMLVAVEEEKVQ
jgi:hypothetical protein